MIKSDKLKGREAARYLFITLKFGHLFLVLVIRILLNYNKKKFDLFICN